MDANGCSWTLEISVKLIRGTVTSDLSKGFLEVPCVLDFEAIHSDFEITHSRWRGVGSCEDQEVLLVVSER